MKKRSDHDIRKLKAQLHVNIAVTLMFIAFTLFAFIVTVKVSILKDDKLVALQLVLSIPLLMSSMLARSKLAVVPHPEKIEKYGHFCFVLAYAFMINAVGIMLASLVSLFSSVVFFLGNIIITLGYAWMIVKSDKKSLRTRLYKDSCFIACIVLFGLLHALGIY